MFLKFLKKRKKWLSHRYYKSKIQGKNNTLSLKGHLSIVSPEKLTVVDNCCINDGVQIHAGGGITFGDNVTISMGAKLITRSYDTENWFEPVQLFFLVYAFLEKVLLLVQERYYPKNVEESYVLVAGSPARVVKRYSQGI